MLSEGLVSGYDRNERLTAKEILQRDWRLLMVLAIIVVLENMRFGRYLLYPFTIFSTWVHETCHGIAAIMMGGNIYSLSVYADGSGLARNAIPNNKFSRCWVASAGYVGTSVLGCLLLLFRRTKKGPRIGTVGLGVLMLLTCALYVRNTFGLAALIPMGLLITVGGIKLPSNRMRDLYTLLAATTSLNAVESIHDLFGGCFYVNGEPATTDAYTVSNQTGINYKVIAVYWFVQALILTAVGLIFAIKDPDFTIDDDPPCCVDENQVL